MNRFIAYILAALSAFMIGYGLRVWQSDSMVEPTVQSNKSTTPLTLARKESPLAKTTSSQRLPKLLALTNDPSVDWESLFAASKMDNIERLILVNRWIASDAQACWKFLTSHDRATFLDYAPAAIKTWAALNPESAFNAAAALGNRGHDRDNFRWMALRSGLNHHSIDRMALLVEQLGDAYTFSGRSDRDVWVKRAPQAATHFLASLPSTHRFRGSLHTATKEWVAQDPEAALAWAETQNTGLYGSVLSSYLDAKKSAKAITSHEILELALTSTSTRLRGTLAIGAVSDISSKEPALAFEWAAKHLQESDLNGIGAMIISNASHGSNAHSVDQLKVMVENLPPSELRGGAAEKIARNEIYKAPDDTLAWLATLDLPLRENAMSNLALNFGRSNQAAKWLAESPPSEFATKTLESATEHILENKDAEATRAWAATLPTDRANHVLSKLEEQPSK